MEHLIWIKKIVSPESTDHCIKRCTIEPKLAERLCGLALERELGMMVLGGSLGGYSNNINELYLSHR